MASAPSESRIGDSSMTRVSSTVSAVWAGPNPGAMRGTSQGAAASIAVESTSNTTSIRLATVETTRHERLFHVDFAKHAESMGAVAETVHSIGDLEQAFARAKKADRTAVIVIKVQSHEWTPGDAWWDVGVPQVSARDSVRKASAEHAEGKRNQRLGV